jgi:5-methylcytosine-specific restriction endonuclease McrA
VNGERGKSWQGSKWCRPSTRLAIYLRDGFACAYCQAKLAERGTKLTLDHLHPVELGGTNAPENLVTACISCNSSKQHISLRGFLSRLRRRGVDTREIAARVRKLVRRKLDRAAARRLLAERKG